MVERKLSRLEQKALTIGGIIPKGLALKCPKCDLWSRHSSLIKKGTVVIAECPDCQYEFVANEGIE